MVDKDLIPFAGDKSTRERLRELDENYIGLWVVLGVTFSKMIEAYAGILMQLYGFRYGGLDFTRAVWWTVLFILVTIIFVHELHTIARRKAGEVAEDVEDKIPDD